jgi:hypothetical protein
MVLFRHVACYFGKVRLLFWDKKEVFLVLFYVFIVLTRYVFVFIFVLFIFSISK